MALEDLLSAMGDGSTRVRQRLNDEISRLVERGLLDTNEAEVLKERFRSEVDKQAQRGFETFGLVKQSLGVAVREFLDLPSRRELQSFMDSIDHQIRDAQAPRAALDVPIHEPGSQGQPGRVVEILPQIHSWSRWSEDKSLYFNSYHIQTQMGAVVIDPVDPGTDELRNALLDLGDVKVIVITNRNHVRAAPWLAKTTRAKVVMHLKETPAQELRVDERVKEDDLILGELRILDMPGKSPGEMALLREADGGQLFLGDALIGKPLGSLSLLPDDKLDDPKKLRRSLRNLLDEHFDALLLADGHSILADAERFTHAFLRTL